MPLGGTHGRYLRVDLDSGSSSTVTLDQRDLRRFVGGVGLGTWLLSRESPAGVDPLAPEAAVVVALSPLVGSPLTTTAKFAIVAKSPLTDRLNDALASDRFAIQLKASGVDALVFAGRAPDWSLLVVDDGQVRIETARHLLGLSAAEAEARVRADLGDDHEFLGIGPAGERLVRYAGLSTGGRHAGRGGLGAVFGAKRLKGIAVRGTQKTPIAHPERVLDLARDLAKRSRGAATSKYRELGTIANVLVFNRLGALPTRNFQAGSFEHAEAISGEAFHEAEARVKRHCAACTIGCEHAFLTREGKPVRLEYEALFALGPLCGIGDKDSILEAVARCDAHGLDVISTGGTIAFAQECRQRGLLDDAPAFGDGKGLLALIDDIAARHGLGDLLAEGSRRAAAHIGQGSAAFACHVKGLELPGYEPRALQAMALGLAVGTRGADHNRSGAYEEDFRPGANRLEADEAKGRAVAQTEDRAALMDSLILCKFLRGVLDAWPADAARLLAAVTGWDVDAAELETTAARIVNAKRLFNIREGWTRAEDTLPSRFLDEALGGGASAGATLSLPDLDGMILRYYQARGWADDGSVPSDRVAALDLEDLVATEGGSP